MKRKTLTYLLLALVLTLAVVATMVGPPAVLFAQGPTLQELELLDDFDVVLIDAIQVLDDDPNQIVFVTQNYGASCGGGTPATAWKMTLDPSTGDVLSTVPKQTLSLIQNGRRALFESSNGTLFTGGGWCGYKPPYYSTDGGEIWQPATTGVHPSDQTYSYGELDGNVYAGTGNAAYHGQVCRWLGETGLNNWEVVLTAVPPRNIVGTMQTYEGQLFVGTSMLYGSGCETSVPVYVSSDGNVFNPTAGIPQCYKVPNIVTVGDQLIARVFNFFNESEWYIYRWNIVSDEWEEAAPFNLGNRPMVSLGDALFAYGQAPGDDAAGIYRSLDLGQSWVQVAILDAPSVTAMAAHGDTLYIGTYQDSSGTAYIYRMVGRITVSIDIKPGSDPNCFNNDGHGVIPVAILSSADFDATLVDPTSVSLNGQGVRIVGRGNTQAHAEDVNGDGLDDLVVQIEDVDGTYVEGDTTAELTGLYNGIPIWGTDTICIVP